MQARPETLAQVRADIDARLAAAASDRKHAMHTPVVATADADARVMVLRAWDVAEGTLRFHTDVRAPKVAMIEADPRTGVLLYDREAGLQLRVTGSARIERDTALADAAWAGSDAYARRCYLGAAPGEGAEGPVSGLPDWIEGQRPTEEQLASARDNFSVLLVRAERIDWYSLAHTGHRRALFERVGEGWAGRWLTP